MSERAVEIGRLGVRLVVVAHGLCIVLHADDIHATGNSSASGAHIMIAGICILPNESFQNASLQPSAWGGNCAGERCSAGQLLELGFLTID